MLERLRYSCGFKAHTCADEGAAFNWDTVVVALYDAG